jgi:drug/metabolite transporter (DMT)-like permease
LPVGQRTALGPRVLRIHWLLGGLALSMVLQALVLYAAPMKTLFHGVPLPLRSLLPVIVLAGAVLLVEEGRKQCVRTTTWSGSWR